jgi:hypothetical protein
MTVVPTTESPGGPPLPGWVHPSSAGRAQLHRQLSLEVIRDGTLAGLRAAVVIAVFLAGLSLLAGNSPLQIATVLGSAFFADMDPGTATGLLPALAYSLVHAAALVVIGIVIAGLARVAAAAMQGWYVWFLGVLFIAAHIMALPIWFNEEVRRDLSLGSVIAATALGMLAMCAFLWQRTPGIAAAMHEPD